MAASAENASRRLRDATSRTGPALRRSVTLSSRMDAFARMLAMGFAIHSGRKEADDVAAADAAGADAGAAIVVAEASPLPSWTDACRTLSLAAAAAAEAAASWLSAREARSA